MEVGCQRQDLALLPLSPGKKHGIHCIGGCVGTQGRYGRVREISPSTRFDLRAVQPVASRYTDYASPARPSQSHNVVIGYLTYLQCIPVQGEENVAYESHDMTKLK